MVIDTHCHLTDTQYDSDREQMIERAWGAGMSHMITISDSLTEGEKNLQLAEKHEHIFCTIGVHPHNAKDWNTESPAHMREMLRADKKVVGVGEIGLDYHYDNSPRDIQQQVFREQLLIAAEMNLPVVLHCREAIGDVRTVLKEMRPKKLVVHCCSEPWSDVAELVERGYMLSFTGIVTFPNADVLRDTIKQCPIDRIMVETDAPYLAPIPHRGKRNEPMYVAEVLKTVAAIKGITIDEADAITTANAVAFFALPS